MVRGKVYIYISVLSIHTNQDIGSIKFPSRFVTKRLPDLRIEDDSDSSENSKMSFDFDFYTRNINAIRNTILATILAITKNSTLRKLRNAS